MTKRTASMIVACLLAISIISQQTAAAGSTPDKDSRFAQKVRSAVSEMGVGQTSLVSLKLRDKTRLAGYISEIGDRTFVVTDIKNAEATTVAYPDVVQVKGNNLSTGVKIAIVAAIVAGVAIFLYSIKGAFCDGC